MTFRRGQKVVCIAEFGWGLIPGDRGCARQHPKLNEIVQISRVVCDSKGTWLILDGFHPRAAYDAEYFRPLVEKKTDTGFAILEEVRKRTSAGEHLPIKVRESV